MATCVYCLKTIKDTNTTCPFCGFPVGAPFTLESVKNKWAEDMSRKAWEVQPSLAAIHRAEKDGTGGPSIERQRQPQRPTPPTQKPDYQPRPQQDGQYPVYGSGYSQYPQQSQIPQYPQQNPHMGQPQYPAPQPAPGYQPIPQQTQYPQYPQQSQVPQYPQQAAPQPAPQQEKELVPPFNNQPEHQNIFDSWLNM